MDQRESREFSSTREYQQASPSPGTPSSNTPSYILRSFYILITNFFKGTVSQNGYLKV